MNKNIDVVALGELLIDFTDSGLSAQGNGLFEANPGGAPCNVLAMLQRQGYSTAFIGKVGNDIFGRKLKTVLEETGIETCGLVMEEKIRTTLAFVENDETGDRSFSFYRSPGADMMLDESEVDEELIRSARIFHFGTLSMTHEGVRNATKKAIKVARENGLMISFDPNIREMLWDDMEAARSQVEYGLKQCDILKISDNEITWFTGEADYDKAVAKLQQEYEIPLILLSMGRDGSSAFANGCRAEAPAVISEETIETTGAGDTFMGCCLGYVLEHGLKELTEDNLKEMLKFANTAASIITRRCGALKVMPTMEEIKEIMQ